MATEVDRILFVVGDRIVTQSDVAFEAFFDDRDQSPVPAFEGRTADRERLLTEIAVIRQLASDIGVYRPANTAVRTRADAFLGTFANPEAGLRALADWGLDETAFLGFLYSRLVVEQYVQRDVAVGDSAILWRENYTIWVAGQMARAPIRKVRP